MHRFSIGIFALALGIQVPASARAMDCEIISTVETFVSSNTVPNNANCSTYLDQRRVTSVSCYWEFGYRDAKAVQMAENLWQSLKSCRAGKSLEGDLRVNHPDSYLPKFWSGKTGTYRISVKDKAALEQTLVFLAFESSV